METVPDLNSVSATSWVYGLRNVANLLEPQFPDLTEVLSSDLTYDLILSSGSMN